MSEPPPNYPLPPPLHPAGQTKKRVSLKPVLITLGCAILISGGSCAGAIAAGVGGSEWQGTGQLLGWLFLLATGVAVIAFFWFLVVVVINIFR